MPGQTASAVVTVREVASAVYVPAQAVRTRADGTTTITVRTASGDVERPVRTGLRSDRYVQITDGLSAGEQVAVSSAATAGFPGAEWPG